MKKVSAKIVISALFILVLFSLSFAQNEEHITITTYYPSPFGSYRELRAQRMAIGDNYFGPDYCWPPDNCLHQIDANAALVVEGRLGIGTHLPNAPLHVVGAGGDNNVAFFNSSDNIQTAMLSINQFRGFRIRSSGPSGIDMSTDMLGSGLRINGPPNPAWTGNATEIGPEFSGGGAFGNTLLVRSQSGPNSNALEVVGNRDEPFFHVGNNARVGIGTVTPRQALEVNGNAYIDNDAGADLVIDSCNNTIINANSTIQFRANGQNYWVLDRTGNRDFAIRDDMSGTTPVFMEHMAENNALYINRTAVSTSGNLEVKGVLDIGLEVVNKTGRGYATVNCVNKTLVGGGCKLNKGGKLVSSMPDPNGIGWYCEPDDLMYIVTAYAICARVK